MLRKLSLAVFLSILMVAAYHAHAQTDAAGNVTATGVSTDGGTGYSATGVSTDGGATYDAAGNPTGGTQTDTTEGVTATGVSTGGGTSDDTKYDAAGNPVDDTQTKESGEKGGTTDINIGVGLPAAQGTAQAGEMQGDTGGDPDQPVVTGEVRNTDDGGGAMHMTGVEPDEIDNKMMDDTAMHEMGHALQLVPKSTTTTAISGYIKIGDIKGESTDEAKKGGNIDYGWKVEEGSKDAAPSKEIVANGGTTTDPDTLRLQTRDCDDPSATCEPEQATTQDRLRDYTERTANTFEQIREIRVNDEAITMQGIQPFKLFGFIPMHITSTVETSMNPDTFARVKVKFPWYSFLGSGANADETASSTEQAIADLEFPTEPTSAPTEQVSLNFEKIKAHIIEVMSGVFGGS